MSGNREPSTLSAAGGYVCNTKTGHGPASRVSVYNVPDGYVYLKKGITRVDHRIQATRKHKTEWLDIQCGHITSAGDPGCDGCKYKRSK